MVKSKINEKIDYPDKIDLYDEDVGYASPQYEIELYDTPVFIVLGKQKYHTIDKDVIYIPIYLIDKDDIFIRQIGVFETKKNEHLKFIDEDGDIDISKFSEPLLYSTVDKKFITSIYNNNTAQSSISDESDYDSDIEIYDRNRRRLNRNRSAYSRYNSSSDSDSDASIDVNELDLDVISLDSDDDPTLIRVRSAQIDPIKKELGKKTAKGLFDTIQPLPNIPPLKTETHKEAEELKKHFKVSRNNNWLEKYMHNNNYEIIDNEGSGDCYFAVIRDAFNSIGYKTTVAKMRALLADNFTRDLYNNYKEVYDNYEILITELKREIEDINKQNKHYSSIAKKLDEKTDSDSMYELKKVIAEVKKLKEKKKTLEDEVKDTKDIQFQSVGIFKELDTYDKYIDYMQTQKYWADTWAISTLEARCVPQYKTIIMDESAYKQGDNYNVIKCGELSDIVKSKHSTQSDNSTTINRIEYRPVYYIITSFDGSHYQLVSYKNKSIFKFDEIPYSIKCLIVNKCLEKNAGPFYEISEFVNFREALGLKQDSDRDSDDENDEYSGGAGNRNKLSPTVFMFHKNASGKPYPGKGTHEKIASEDETKYIKLNKMSGWRAKLDDAYAIEQSNGYIKIDGLVWKSVDHYMNAVRFKKQNKEFYEDLAKYSPTEVKEITDLNKADKTGIRPKNINEDPDFRLGQDSKYRKQALISKFSQNEDLKQILIATQDAVLNKFIQRKPPLTDELLMEVRKEIQLANRK